MKKVITEGWVIRRNLLIVAVQASFEPYNFTISALKINTTSTRQWLVLYERPS